MHGSWDKHPGVVRCLANSRKDFTFRHGGDFAGLTQKLHYIKGLGCNGLWISPVFQTPGIASHRVRSSNLQITGADCQRFRIPCHRLPCLTQTGVVLEPVMVEVLSRGFCKWGLHFWCPSRQHVQTGKTPTCIAICPQQHAPWCGTFGLKGQPLLTNNCANSQYKQIPRRYK